MKNIFVKLQGKAVPLLLGVALLLTAALSFTSIRDLQGDARVINYTGIVRGATQRLVKKELNHVPDDALIVRLDGILAGLSESCDEFNLIKIPSPEYQSLLAEMETEWAVIKEEILRYRDGGPGDTLFQLSEDYFTLADRTVLAAEVYTEQSVQRARSVMLYMNLAIVLLTIISALSAFYQEKRRKSLQVAEEENQKQSEHLSQLFQELLVPMNEISELMYVSDIDTYDLLFVNSAGRETFHLEEGTDLKCYQALQGLDAPCPFCTIPYIKTDENYTWEYTNPLTTRHYLLKDRLVPWDGRLARLEIAFDITETANEKIELQNRLESDKVLLECLRELHRNHNVPQATIYALEQVGKLFQAERAYIFQVRDNRFSNTAEWCAEGVSPQIENLQDLPMSEFAVWFSVFSNKENLVISNVSSLKESMAAEYELLSKQGIQRVVLVPLERDGVLDGVIGLDNLAPSLMETAASFLQTLRYFLMLAIRRSEDEETLSRLSYQDTLTSFYNRNRYIHDIRELEDKSCSVGVVFLDVNGLKEINDHLGHDMGDRVLRECAQTIRGVFHEGSFYRIGGDEFVIICTDVEEESFDRTVLNLRASFRRDTCHAAVGTRWAKTCRQIQAIINAADEAMYADKKAFYQNHQPSGRYRHHNDSFHYLTDPSVLREKISAGCFLVYLQPKIDAKSRRAVGAEALVRYRGQEGRIESPDNFIPLLEDSHLISLVDFHVLETVCAIIRGWEARGKELFPISSNFSRSSFMEDSFVERLETICNKYRVPKVYLEIELTESVNDVDYGQLRTQIDRVRSAGFQVSIDDFGTECSNLALLSTATFDVLKIDKSFVRDITLNRSARTVVESMVVMCRKMDIRLIAEGVEDEEQLAVLMECGVRVVQGFLFSRPVPIDEYEKNFLS